MGYHCSMAIFDFAQQSYLQLPSGFYSRCQPAIVAGPKLECWNSHLASELSLDGLSKQEKLAYFSGNETMSNGAYLAQAYGGHQFGHYTTLGDGRAILLGELVLKNGNRVDVQLKGAGQTPYSRGGDGKATLRWMLKEYLYSEALYYLGLSTSRSLAVVSTEEEIFRQEGPEQAAILTRVMQSHLRVGTFEWVSRTQGVSALQKLLEYAVNRHYPELKQSDTLALDFIKHVMKMQIQTVSKWMTLGFVHGVMNTDNTSITGETFDYGPCAFINDYNPAQVYSSIDRQGRYAFGNQPRILLWNLARLTESLLPLIDSDSKVALKKAQDLIDSFEGLYLDEYYHQMGKKIGWPSCTLITKSLLNDFLEVLSRERYDLHHCFLHLERSLSAVGSESFQFSSLDAWIMKWKTAISEANFKIDEVLVLMKASNPVFILRNEDANDAISSFVEGDPEHFRGLVEKVATPFRRDPNGLGALVEHYFESSNFRTYCGT